MRRALAILLLSVLAAAVAGCGGGALSREEFVEKANANCAERQKAERKIYAKESYEDPEEWMRPFDKELEKQKELEPPEEMRADWRRYQELSRESIAAFRRIARNPRGANGDVEVVARRSSTQSRVVARELGLDVCAKQIY